MFEIVEKVNKKQDKVYRVAYVCLEGVLLHDHIFIQDLAGAEKLLARVRQSGKINRAHWTWSLSPLELNWPLCDRDEFLEIFDGEPNWLEGRSFLG